MSKLWHGLFGFYAALLIAVALGLALNCAGATMAAPVPTAHVSAMKVTHSRPAPCHRAHHAACSLCHALMRSADNGPRPPVIAAGEKFTASQRNANGRSVPPPLGPPRFLV